MFPIERRKAILDCLDARRSVTVEELAKLLYTGEATIRRDLDRMAKEGLLTRTHGGAVRLSRENSEFPYDFRESVNAPAKERMAETAAELVRDGESLFLDGSSTVIRMIGKLASRRGLKLVTNGVKTALELSRGGFDGVCTGGEFSMASGTLTGAEAVRSANRYNCDKFFFSCKALSVEAGLCEGSAGVADVKEAMARHARMLVLLADASKFDRTALCSLDLLPRLGYVITDERPGEAWMTLFAKNGTKVLLA